VAEDLPGSARVLTGGMAWRVLSGVQKIQCLESSMADASHDGAAFKEELAKLLHERNSLPHNLGSCPPRLGRGRCEGCGVRGTGWRQLVAFWQNDR